MPQQSGDKMNTKELINEVVSLPVEERTLIIDTVLRSLNQPESEIDKKWVSLAQKRLEEIRTGTVNTIPGNEVFKKVWQRFEK